MHVSVLSIVVIWQVIELLPLLAIVIALGWGFSARAINRFSILAYMENHKLQQS